MNDLATGISIGISIGALIISSFSLALSAREKQRTIKVALRWGIDPKYQKSSGVVLWITVANAGYQPVVLNGVRLHVDGIRDDLTLAKPWTTETLPLSLKPGHTFGTSVSAEVLLHAFADANRAGTVSVKAIVDTVFKEFGSSRTTIDTGRLSGLVEFVSRDTQYARFKTFVGSMGSIVMRSFDDVDRYVRNLVRHGFTVQEVPGVGDGESGS